MKVVALHGPAISASRKKLTEIKQKFDTNDVVTFEKGSEISDILASLQTVSMFEENRLVVLENPPEDFTFESLTNYDSLNLVIWYDHEIKNIPKSAEVLSAQILFFPETREISVFPFLDKLGMKEKQAFVEMNKLKQAGYDTQYLITMIFYLLRNLVATPKTSKDFVRNKNERMRRNFSPEELINLYKFVLETDFKMKNGLIETSQAEFLIINRFID